MLAVRSLREILCLQSFIRVGFDLRSRALESAVAGPGERRHADGTQIESGILQAADCASETRRRCILDSRSYQFSLVSCGPSFITVESRVAEPPARLGVVGVCRTSSVGYFSSNAHPFPPTLSRASRPSSSAPPLLRTWRILVHPGRPARHQHLTSHCVVVHRFQNCHGHHLHAGKATVYTFKASLGRARALSARAFLKIMLMLGHCRPRPLRTPPMSLLILIPACNRAGAPTHGLWLTRSGGHAYLLSTPTSETQTGAISHRALMTSTRAMCGPGTDTTSKSSIFSTRSTQKCRP